MAHGNRDPKPGDLIEIKRSLRYQHWALYVGDGYVIHVTDVGAKDVCMSVSSGSNLTGKAKVKKQLLNDVVGNNSWSVNNKYDRYHTPLPVEDIIQGAERLIDMEVEYSVLLKNCEHFVTLLRYDKEFSDQVIRGAALAGGIILASMIAIAWNRFHRKRRAGSSLGTERRTVELPEVQYEEYEIPAHNDKEFAYVEVDTPNTDYTLSKNIK